MSREIPLLCRWALVSRRPDGTAAVRLTYYTLRGARAALRRNNTRRSTWNDLPRLELEPTDWAPRCERHARVVRVLLEEGPLSAADVSARTALSPWCVEQVLLELGRRRWVVCRTPAVVGEERAGQPAAGVWRLRTPVERQAEVSIDGKSPPIC